MGRFEKFIPKKTFYILMFLLKMIDFFIIIIHYNFNCFIYQKLFFLSVKRKIKLLEKFFFYKFLFLYKLLKKDLNLPIFKVNIFFFVFIFFSFNIIITLTIIIIIFFFFFKFFIIIFYFNNTKFIHNSFINI